MDLEQRLRASLVAPDPGAMFTARVMARVGRGAARRRSSFILIGTVLVVGAAAAMLTWRMSPPRENAATPMVSDPVPVVEEAVARAIPEVSEPDAPVLPPEPAPQDVSAGYSVLLMPLRQEAQDVSRLGPVEALYASMLDELRKVPGLTLHVPGESERGADDQADYVLTISSLATAHRSDGGVTFRATDGGNTYTVNSGSLDVDYGIPQARDGGVAGATYGSGAAIGVVDLVLNNSGAATGVVDLALNMASVNIDLDPDEARDGGGANFFSAGGRGSLSSVSADGRVISFNPGGLANPESLLWVEMRVKPRQSAASRYTFPVGADLATKPLHCSSPNGVRLPECMTPAQLAATQVEMLRLQVFPPDAAYQQRVMARLSDISLDGTKVLLDLLPLLTGDGGSRLDTGTIHALFRFAAGQPENTRAEVWRMLRQVSHPALVAPLVESLRHDPDQQVRLAALVNLEANHATDPVVRNAFEGIDQGDPDAMVRAAVRWTLYGQAQWRNDVLAALQDTNLPYGARLAPLVVRTAADFSPQQSGQMALVRRAVLQEQQVLQPLMALIRGHLRDSEHAQATGDVLRMLANVDDPAVFDLFLQLMQETSLPIQVSSAVANWAINRPNDPRVRENLPLVAPMIPSNLLERMREVTQQAAPSGN